jgi:hypothetical protein
MKFEFVETDAEFTPRSHIYRDESDIFIDFCFNIINWILAVIKNQDNMHHNPNIPFEENNL